MNFFAVLRGAVFTRTTPPRSSRSYHQPCRAFSYALFEVSRGSVRSSFTLRGSEPVWTVNS